MAKFSFHCQCYKVRQLGGIDKHNRRLIKHYISNPDINTERSGQNCIYIAPKQSLYKDCKKQIEKRVIGSVNVYFHTPMNYRLNAWMKITI